MLLDIEIAAFDAAHHPSVVRLLEMIAEERHDWRPSPAVATAAERFLAQNLPNYPVLAEMVRKSLEETANPYPSRAYRVPVDAARLKEIVENLGREAVVVVEDGITEECFLLAAARTLGRTRIVEGRRLEWLRFSHAGGKDRMERFVTREKGRFHIVARVVALLDSDSKIPRQRTRNHRYADNIRSTGVDVHIWAYAEVENYVPIRVWEHHFPDRATKIRMLLHMRPDQRGHVDIKHGLKKSDSDAGVAAHFADLPAEVRETWHTGLASSRRGIPSPLIPDGLALAEEDFAELGPEAVTELKDVLAMIEQIL